MPLYQRQETTSKWLSVNIQDWKTSCAHVRRSIIDNEYEQILNWIDLPFLDYKLPFIKCNTMWSNSFARSDSISGLYTLLHELHLALNPINIEVQKTCVISKIIIINDSTWCHPSYLPLEFWTVLK
jgi:hypothetical protein